MEKEKTLKECDYAGDCPKCKDDTFVLNGEIVCMNPYCDFRQATA